MAYFFVEVLPLRMGHFTKVQYRRDVKQEKVISGPLKAPPITDTLETTDSKAMDISS